MEAELAALASSGATALIGLMVSDSWTQVKEVFARLFAHGGAVESPLQELEAARIELVTAHLEGDDAKATAIEATWRNRLNSLLQTDTAAKEQLQHLIDPLTSRPTGSVYNVNSGEQYGSTIQAGQISGTVFHITTTPDKYTRQHNSRNKE